MTTSPPDGFDTHGHASSYHADIDGLRAVAVFLVVACHYDLFYLSGGFVGIDIFFVISGFLISKILIADMHAARFSFRAFYERRVRRLAPALLSTLALSAICASLLFTPDDLKLFAHSLMTSLVIIPNFFFATQTGYFGPLASHMPLLHLWSLGIEEQFYIIFPLILIGLQKLKVKSLGPFIAALFFASFAASLYLTTIFPEKSYFWPHTRAWELLAGAIIVVCPRPRHIKTIHTNVISFAALCLIFGAGVDFDANSLFPGAAALVPVLGAMGLIFIGHYPSFVKNNILSSPPLVQIGRASYSIYLMHWPLFVFAHYILDGRSETDISALLCIISILLGFLSWRFIETPFRGTHPLLPHSRIFKATLASGLIMMASGAALFISGGWPQRLNERAQHYAAISTQHKKEYHPACLIDEIKDLKIGKSCAPQFASTPPRVIIWGDSHASRLTLMAEHISTEHNLPIAIVEIGGCPPFDGISHKPLNSTDICQGMGAELTNILARMPSVEVVVLAARWPIYTTGAPLKNEHQYHYILQDERNLHWNAPQTELFITGLQRTIEHLTHAGKKVIIIGSIPEMRAGVANVLTHQAQFHLPEHIDISTHAYHKRNAVFDAALKQVSALRFDILDPSLYLCDANLCSGVKDFESLYIDNNHLSIAGTMLLKNPLIELILKDLKPDH